MTIALFLVLAIVLAAVIAQPLLPGSRSTYPLPAGRERGVQVRDPRAVRGGQGRICPSCAAPVKADDRFCVGCGTALADFQSAPACASCSAPLSEDDRFCRKCGAAVAGKEVQQ